MNLNTVAKDVTLKEAGKISVSIAQVKEVIRCFMEVAREYPDSEIISAIRRRR